MRISLIQPHYQEGIKGTFPSLGLGYIAAVLEKGGHEVDYLDIDALNIQDASLRAHFSSLSPEMIGITCNSPTYNEARKVARLAKEASPQSFTLLGGPHLDVYPLESIDHPEFDAGIYGEGEQAILELTDALESRSGFEKVNGLIYKAEGKIIVNPPRQPFKNLDSLPFPARHLTPIEKYVTPKSKRNPYTTLITSRGCPFKCFYCRPVQGDIFRARNPDSVVAEIRECVDTLGIQEIQFYDDSFTISKQRVNAICESLIRENLDFIWDCRTRVDLVDKPLLAKMREAGCERVRYGVESGNPRMLSIMKTGLTLDRVEEVFAWSKELGMETLGFFMLGTMGETMAEIQDTISFAKALRPTHIRFSITTAYPGTEMYNRALKEGYFKTDVWKEYTLGLTDTVPNPVFETEEYTTSDLENLISRTYEEFYS